MVHVSYGEHDSQRRSLPDKPPEQRNGIRTARHGDGNSLPGVKEAAI
jgi:hypothetical protein